MLIYFLAFEGHLSQKIQQTNKALCKKNQGSEIEKDDMKRTYEELRQAAGKELFSSSSFALSQPTLRIDFNLGRLHCELRE